MGIQTLLGIDGYSLLVCHRSGNLYAISVIDRENQTYNFQGVYPSLEAAIERGKSIIENLKSLQKDTSSRR